MKLKYIGWLTRIYEIKAGSHYALNMLCPVWPDWAIYWTLATFQSVWQQLLFPTFLGNFCKGVQICNFSSDIISEQGIMCKKETQTFFLCHHHHHRLQIIAFEARVERGEKNLIDKGKRVWERERYHYLVQNVPMRIEYCRWRVRKYLPRYLYHLPTYVCMYAFKGYSFCVFR